MATTFTGLRVQDTYNAILKIGDNSNLSGTAKILSDGVGNSSSIYLSTTRFGIGITPAYQFHTSGNAKIGGNLIISGNLTVNGTLTYLNVEDLAVEDPLIKLAKDNTANTLDIGFFGKYVATGTKYKGLFNDASDDKFKLFIGTSTEPTTTVDTTASGYTMGTLVANIEGGTGTFTGLVSGIAPTSDLNFATKKYVDDQTIPTPTLSSVLSAGDSSGANDLKIIDDQKLLLGDDGDMQIYHNQVNSVFFNDTGNIVFRNNANDSDISFQTDDGLGYTTEYLRLDGDDVNVVFSKPISGTTASFSGLVTGIAPTSDLNFATKKYVDDQTVPTPTLSSVLGTGNTSGANDIIMADDQKVFLGTDSDLEIYHDGTDGYIDNINGELIIQNNSDDKKIIFKSDNGIGDITEYFRIDGNINRNVITVTTQLNDNVPLIFGSGAGRPSIKYDSTASQLFIGGESKFLNDATFSADVTLTDGVLTVNEGNNYVKLSQGANSISEIELKDGTPVYVQGWGDSFRVAVNGDYTNRAFEIASDKSATFTGTLTSGDISTTGITVDSRLVIQNSLIYDNAANGNNKGFGIGGAGLVPLNGSGVDTNNLVDIGTSDYKFKNLHLSGFIQADGNITTDGIFINNSAPDDEVVQFIQNGRKTSLKTYFSTGATGSHLDFRISDGSATGGFNTPLVLYPNRAIITTAEITTIKTNNIEKATTGSPILINSGADASTALRVYYDMQLYNTLRFTNASWSTQGFIAGGSGILQLSGGSGTSTIYINSSDQVSIRNNADLGTYTRLGIAMDVGGNAANLDEATDYNAMSIAPYRVGSSYGMYFGGGHGANSSAGFIQSAKVDGTDSSTISLNPFGGAVGINTGTSDPSSTLHIKGSFRTHSTGTYPMGILNEFVSTYVSRTKFGNLASSSNLEIYYDISGTEEARITRNYSVAPLKFTRAGTTDMEITGTGNVLIPGQGKYLKFGGYSYIGESLEDLHSLTIASDFTESLRFSHYNRTTSAYELNMIIDDNSRVGINTPSPTTLLHLDQPSNDRAGGLYIKRNGSNYGLSAFVNAGGYGVIGSNGSQTNDILTMNLSNGNVGIGISDPFAAKLVVNSSSNPQILVKKQTAGGGAEILFEHNSGGTQYASIKYDQSGQNALYITTGYDSPNDLNRIYLQPGGETALTLFGGNNSTGTAGTVTLNVNAWLKGYAVANSTQQNLIRSRAMGYPGYYGLQIGQETNHIALFIDPGSVAGGAFSGNVNEIMLPNKVIFQQANSGGTDWLNGQSITLDNAKLGLGINTPLTKFHIQDGAGGGNPTDSRTKLYINSSGEAYISMNVPTNSFGGIRLAVGGSNKAFFELYDNTTQGQKLTLGTVDARDVVINTTNTERLRINSNGNVNLLNTSSTDSRHFGITNAAGTTGWTFGNGVIANSHQFVIYDNTAGDDRLLINSSGSIGINCDAGNVQLKVLQTRSSEWAGGFINTGSVGYGLYVDTASSGNTQYNFACYTNTGDGMALNGAGRLHIGNKTSFPSKLTVTSESSALKAVEASKPYAASQNIASFTNGNAFIRNSYDTFTIAQTDVPCLVITETVNASNQGTEQRLTLTVGDNKCVIGTSSTVTTGMYFNVARSTSALGYQATNGLTALHLTNDGYATFYSNIVVPANIYVGEYIYHKDDTNTYLRFTEDQFTFRTGGDDRMKLTNNALNVGPGTTTSSTIGDGPLRVVNNSNGSSTMGRNSVAIQLGPKSTRTATANYYYGGMTWNGLLNYGNNTVYDIAPHVWVGAKFKDFPGSERSSFVVGVKSGTGVTGSGNNIPVERLEIDYTGKMTVSGNILATGSITANGDVIAFSDKRLKENIKPIKNALKKVTELKGVSYNRIDIDDKSNKIGFIAQDVKKVLPEVVSDNEKYLGVNYGNITAVLVEAIKEQQKQIVSLQKEINNLKNK